MLEVWKIESIRNSPEFVNKKIFEYTGRNWVCGNMVNINMALSFYEAQILGMFQRGTQNSWESKRQKLCYTNACATRFLPIEENIFWFKC